jgi:hypothetical protein
MTLNGFDPASDARFRATVEIETKYTHQQIDLLWQHNRKRQEELKTSHRELAKRIGAVDKKLTADIEEIESRINGAVYAVAAAALAGLWVFIKPHLGF